MQRMPHPRIEASARTSRPYWLLKTDRPRAIDRFINYFGESCRSAPRRESADRPPRGRRRHDVARRASGAGLRDRRRLSDDAEGVSDLHEGVHSPLEVRDLVRGTDLDPNPCLTPRDDGIGEPHNIDSLTE